MSKRYGNLAFYKGEEGIILFLHLSPHTTQYFEKRIKQIFNVDFRIIHHFGNKDRPIDLPVILLPFLSHPGIRE